MMCSTMLEIFYQSIMAVVLLSSMGCWEGNISAIDTERLKKLTKKAGSLDWRRLNKLLSRTMFSTTHKTDNGEYLSCLKSSKRFHLSFL